MTTHVAAGSQPADGSQRPAEDESGRGPQDEAGLSPHAVVAVWAVLLGLLATVSGGFGHNTVALEISGSATGLVVVVAGAVWLDQRLRPRRDASRWPARPGGGFLLAVIGATAGLALVLGPFMLMVAAVQAAAAIGLEIAARRHRRARVRSPWLPPGER